MIKGTERLGTHAYRITPSTEEDRRRYLAAIARMTPSDQIHTAYDLMGNIYGHDIPYTDDDAEDRTIDALREGYDNAVLHDRGWPVRSKASGELGFLAMSHLDGRDPPDPDVLREFEIAHGIVAQPVSKWYDEDANIIVAFVPGSRLSEAASLADALEDLAQGHAPTAGS